MAFFARFIHRQFIYEPPVPTASFKGKTAIVTGASSGLGLEACRWMVRLGASQVILACRNLEKGKAAAKDIQATTSCSSDTLEVWHLDLSSYESVQDFWRYNNNTPVDQIKMRESIYLFKEGFQPVWEDRRNINGGSWTFRVPKVNGPDFWTRVQLMAIGEKLQGCLDVGKNYHTLS